MKKEDTERIQRAYDKLSVGCEVKIIDPHLDHEFGDIGTVEKMCRDLTVYVSVKGKSSWYYWPYKLELIRKFKVGDRVKTVRVTDRCVPKRYENQIAMVTHIDDEDNGYKVKYVCDNDSWWLREDNLILDPEPQQINATVTIGSLTVPLKSLVWIAEQPTAPIAYDVEDDELEGLYPGIYGVPLVSCEDNTYSFDQFCKEYNDNDESFTLHEFFWYMMIYRRTKGDMYSRLMKIQINRLKMRHVKL